MEGLSSQYYGATARGPTVVIAFSDDLPVDEAIEEGVLDLHLADKPTSVRPSAAASKPSDLGENSGLTVGGAR